MTVYLSTENGHHRLQMAPQERAARVERDANRRSVKQRAKKSRANGGHVSSADREAPESTRERLLISATRFFAEQGFASTSMPAIAKASGVTAGAIYKHFKSKADLLFEVTRRAVASIPLFVQASQRKNDAVSLATLAAAYTQPELKLLRQLSIEMHSAATKDAKVKRVLSVSDQRAISAVSEIVAAEQHAGRIDAGLNPEFAATAYCIFIMGLTHMETLSPDLAGNKAWRDFVSDRIAALIGLK